jgi:hypothetical protein
MIARSIPVLVSLALVGALGCAPPCTDDGLKQDCPTDQIVVTLGDDSTGADDDADDDDADDDDADDDDDTSTGSADDAADDGDDSDDDHSLDADASGEDSSSGAAPQESSSGADDSSVDEGPEEESTTEPIEPAEGFADCLQDFDACDADEVCILVAQPGWPDNGTVCAGQECVTADDCPSQPGGGDAPTVCEDVTADDVADCIISCENGETCPDGMVCAVELLCAWPTPWTCDPGYYGTDDGCDCGCGLSDPDCDDDGVAACDYCNDAGSCSATVCPGEIDPNDNAVCD